MAQLLRNLEKYLANTRLNFPLIAPTAYQNIKKNLF